MATGGVIDKFIGDAILAHWGAVEEEIQDGQDNESLKKSHAGNIKAALRSALLMRASLQCFNQNCGSNRYPYIKIGCGISSGKVAAGLIGTDERLVYTVIGEAVNLAEKAEASNKVYGTEILISSHTAKIVKDDFILESLPALSDVSLKLAALINTKSEEQTNGIQEELERLKGISKCTARHCIGHNGPKNIRELRVLLGINELDYKAVKSDEREKKFKVHRP